LPSALAYVFWHWPRPGVSTNDYEAKLSAFQSALKAANPRLVASVLSYKVDSLTWGPKDGPVYEDWYLVDGFAALGSLNDAAVTGGTKGFHDSVARDYLKGAGGVFKLMLGDVFLEQARYSTWIEKPTGMTYQSFYERVAKMQGDRKADLWRRQMVLGPSPQFCVHSVGRIEFPEEFHPLVTAVSVVR
jgi:hypothetical protein